MKNTVIVNSEELRTEISRLRGQGAEQKAALAMHFSGHSAVIASIKGLFPKSSDKETAGGLYHPDILKLVSRFIIPFALDKTIFRRSNFLVKALVGLVSQKAIGLVNEGSAEHLLAQGKTLISNLFSKHKSDEQQPIMKIKSSQ